MRKDGIDMDENSPMANAIMAALDNAKDAIAAEAHRMETGKDQSGVVIITSCYLMKEIIEAGIATAKNTGSMVPLKSVASMIGQIVLPALKELNNVVDEAAERGDL